MRVLVTGHRGYIGAVMVPMLLDAGHEVVGLDNGLFDRCSYGDFQLSDVSEFRMDVRDVTERELDGFQAVVHLANLSNDPLGDLNPGLTMEINHLATVRLAELSKKCGVERFVFSSSCSTYGEAGEGFVAEDASFNPVTPYGRAKVLAERDLQPLADDNFSPTYLRNATAYGMSPRLRFDLVLNNLVAWAASAGKILLKSDGSPWRPIVHIKDISRAFIAVLAAPRERIHNEAFNVGRTSENYRIREIAEIVGEVVPGCNVELASGASPDRRSYRVDFSKIETQLPDFAPEWDARKGAEEIYSILKDADLTPDDFEGTRYRRIKHIQELLGRGELSPELRWTQEVFNA